MEALSAFQQSILEVKRPVKETTMPLAQTDLAEGKGAGGRSSLPQGSRDFCLTRSLRSRTSPSR
jgi:hypothetical protein